MLESKQLLLEASDRSPKRTGATSHTPTRRTPTSPAFRCDSHPHKPSHTYLYAPASAVQPHTDARQLRRRRHGFLSRPANRPQRAPGPHTPPPPATCMHPQHIPQAPHTAPGARCHAQKPRCSAAEHGAPTQDRSAATGTVESAAQARKMRTGAWWTLAGDGARRPERGCMWAMLGPINAAVQLARLQAGHSLLLQSVLLCCTVD